MQGHRFQYPINIQGRTRFTPSLLKEAVFEILLNRIASSGHKSKDYVFFDLSAGSGQMALEALSLGFQKIYISEVEPLYLANIKKQFGLAENKGPLLEIHRKELDSPVSLEMHCRDFRRMSPLIHPHLKSVLYFDLPYSFWKAKNPLGLEGFLSRLEKSLLREEETRYRWIFIQGPRFFEPQKMELLRKLEFRRYGRQHLTFWLASKEEGKGNVSRVS